MSKTKIQMTMGDLLAGIKDTDNLILMFKEWDLKNFNTEANEDLRPLKQWQRAAVFMGREYADPITAREWETLLRSAPESHPLAVAFLEESLAQSES
jgi:hypothetical protein